LKLKFKSKRNTVLLRDNIVEKHCASIELANIELQILEQLKKAEVNVPQVYSQNGAVLKMEYIPGKTLPDLIEEYEASAAMGELSYNEAAMEIVKWFDDFYHAVSIGEIRGDVNGRNFIFYNNQCWGVDFEERIYGTKEQDMGRLIAFVLTYDPPHTTVKTAFTNSLLYHGVNVLKLDAQEICRWRDLEFHAMLKRR